jgi:hypothetical protein
MAESVYYEKPVLLDRKNHKDTKVLPSDSFAFAAKANSLFVAGAEFNEACKEYGIVFTRVASGKIVPVVMLGLRAQENLFVTDKGEWTGRYVPAFVRRYPFVLAQLPDQALGVCVDESYKGLNEKEGEPLFGPDGTHTPFLQNAVDFLTEFQREYLRTEIFCQHLEEAGLFMEMNARADLVDGRTFTVAGLLIVDEKKLMQLPDAQVLKMFRAGEMHLVSMHLTSLSNMKSLVDRMVKRHGGAMPPAPQAAAGEAPAKDGKDKPKLKLKEKA